MKKRNISIDAKRLSMRFNNNCRLKANSLQKCSKRYNLYVKEDLLAKSLTKLKELGYPLVLMIA